MVAFRAAALHLHRRLPADRVLAAFRPCALQDTPPGSALLGAAARLEGVTPCLWQDPRVVSLWAMRSSPFLVAVPDLPIFTTGLVDGPAPDDPFLDWLADRLHTLLDGRAVTKGGLRRALYRELPRRWQGPCPFPVLIATAGRAVPRSGGYIIAARVGGPWSYDWAVGRADQCVGATHPYDPEEARKELVRRFLRAFGPATLRDFVWCRRGTSTPPTRQRRDGRPCRTSASRSAGTTDRSAGSSPPTSIAWRIRRRRPMSASSRPTTPCSCCGTGRPSSPTDASTRSCGGPLTTPAWCSLPAV